MAEEKWWDEEAERLNKMGELAQKRKIQIKVGKGKPPELDKDGVEIPGLKRIKEILKKKK